MVRTCYMFRTTRRCLSIFFLLQYFQFVSIFRFRNIHYFLHYPFLSCFFTSTSFLSLFFLYFGFKHFSWPKKVKMIKSLNDVQQSTKYFVGKNGNRTHIETTPQESIQKFDLPKKRLLLVFFSLLKLRSRILSCNAYNDKLKFNCR